VLALAWALAAPGSGTAGAAGPDDLVADLPTTSFLPQPWAASGDDLIATDRVGDDGVTRVSTDGGATWAPVDLPKFGGAMLDWSGSGRVVYHVDAGSAADYYTYNFGDGTVSEPRRLSTTAEAVNDRVALTFDRRSGGYSAVDLATGAATVLDFVPDGNYVVPALDTGPQALLATFDGDGGTLYLVPTDGSPATLPPAEVPGLLTATLSGSHAAYVVATSKRLSFCVRALADWQQEDCTELARGDHRDGFVTVGHGEDWFVVGLMHDTGEKHWLLGAPDEPLNAVPLDEAVDSVWEELLSVGASDRPLVIVWESDAGSYLARILADGSLAPIEGDFRRPAWVGALQLTPTTLSGLDDRPDGEGWDQQHFSRPLADFGTEQLQGRATGLFASANRTLVVQDGESLRGYDGDTQGPDLPDAGEVTTLSGPRYLAADERRLWQVRSVDGSLVYEDETPLALFGPRVLIAARYPDYALHDIVTGTDLPVLIPAAWENGFTPHSVWGDAVLGSVTDARGGAVTSIVIDAGAGSAAHSAAGTPLAIGDGFAVLSDGDDVVAWSWRTDARLTLSTTGTSVAATDGSARVALVRDDRLVVTSLAGLGVGTTQPLLLGAIGSRGLHTLPVRHPWVQEFDATKPLAAGTLTITGSDGTTVRELRVPASPSGSIRVSWDGLDEHGVTVAAGTMLTWTLDVAATDGTGALTTVDGEPVQGSIAVDDAISGSVRGSTPSLSDTWPVFGTLLTASAGTWSADGERVELSYQWYRGKTPIPGATAREYTVGLGDLGRRLKVVVTGSAGGHTDTSLASGRTHKVRTAELDPTPIPQLSGNPVVGSTLTATVEPWGDGTPMLAYQWYRVKKGRTTPVGDGSDTYQLVGRDAGSRVQVAVTGSLPGYTTTTLYSAPTAKVAVGDFASAAAPTIVLAGSPRVGKTLLAVPGDHVPAATDVSFRWYRQASGTTGWTAIRKATKASYRPTGEDLGALLKVRVTASATGYRAESQEVTLADPVLAGIATVLPLLDDTTPTVGHTIGVTPASRPEAAWRPAPAADEVTYRWYAGGKRITGATGPTFTVRKADRGKRLRVTAAATVDGLAASSAAALTSKVAAAA
jgi:hypothetical protein